MGNLQEVKLKTLKKILNTTYNSLYFVNKKREREIVFCSARSKQLTGNIKNLEEEYLRQGVKHRVYTYENKGVRSFWHYIKTLNYLSYAKLFILDDYNLAISGLDEKKNDNMVVQLWHAVGVYKAFGRSKHEEGIIKHHSNYDVAFVNSAQDKPFYMKSFYIDESSLIEMGAPKLDSIIANESNDKRYVLYAPTYREDKEFAINEVEKTIKQLNNIRDYEVYVSLHPYMSINDIKASKLNNVKFITSDKQRYEVMGKCKFLITDFSSILFDFSYYEEEVFLYFFNDSEKSNVKNQYYVTPDKLKLPIYDSIEGIVNDINAGSFTSNKENLLKLKDYVYKNTKLETTNSAAMKQYLDKLIGE